MTIDRLKVNEEKLENIKKYSAEQKKTLTGYPHIDKPWMQYYDEKKIEEYENNIPHATLVEYLKEKNKGLEDTVAISSYGKETKYSELYKEIDRASKALTGLGVKENDRVLYLLPNLLETAALFYGTSQIGAVSDYMDPRPDSVNLQISAEKILNMIKAEKIKHIVAIDQCYLALLKPVEEQLKELNINNIVLISPDKFMDKKSKRFYIKESITFNGFKSFTKNIKKKKKINEALEEAKLNAKITLIDYSDLLEKTKNLEFKKIEYKPNRTETIVHTSGTTSPLPKAIPLTNDNLNGYVHQTFYSNMPMESGDKALHVLPYFAAFGLSSVLHSGLCHNSTLIQVPEFTPSNLSKMILKYKPQTLIGAPTWYVNMMNDKEFNNKDLSFIKMVTYGGDTMVSYDEEKFNEFLKEHNCKCKITKGHGMSELSGCSTYAIGNYNDLDSIGIPLCGTTYAITNPETGELVNFEDKDYIEGEIIVSSPAASSGKIDDKTNVTHIDIDGIDFIKTGDIARMYKDGKLSFLTRSSRMFTRFDGFKIKPHVVESIIKENPKVENCILTPYYEESYFGNMAKATIVLKDKEELNVDQQTEIIKEIVNDQFVNNVSISSRQIPAKFEIVKELPISEKSGKVDYKSIEKQGLTGNETTVKIEETNISLGDIKVIPPEKKKVKTL